MSADNSDVQNRLDQAMSGKSPEINPDEQREFLGTFRERVEFAISVQNDQNQDAISQLATEMTAHPDYSLLINGNIMSSAQNPYMRLASQNDVKFTLKNDSIYGTNPNQLAVVFSAPDAIHKENVIFNPNQVKNEDESKEKEHPKRSLISRLFKK